MVGTTRRALLAILIAVALPSCKRSVLGASEVPSLSRYAADGLAFSYPDDWTLERGRKDTPLRIVLVRADRAFAVVGWTPRPVDTKRLRETAYVFARDRVLEHDHIDEVRSGALVSRSIGGRQADGVVVYGLSGVVTMVGEVYAVDLAGTSVMLLLFYPEGPAKQDSAMLDVIASSLGPDTN